MSPFSLLAKHSLPDKALALGFIICAGACSRHPPGPGLGWSHHTAGQDKISIDLLFDDAEWLRAVVVVKYPEDRQSSSSVTSSLGVGRGSSWENEVIHKLPDQTLRLIAAAYPGDETSTAKIGDVPIDLEHPTMYLVDGRVVPPVIHQAAMPSEGPAPARAVDGAARVDFEREFRDRVRGIMEGHPAASTW